MPKTSRSMPNKDISKEENIRVKSDPAYAARKTRKFLSDMKPPAKKTQPIKPLAKKKGGK